MFYLSLVLILCGLLTLLYALLGGSGEGQASLPGDRFVPHDDYSTAELRAARSLTGRKAPGARAGGDFPETTGDTARKSPERPAPDGGFQSQYGRQEAEDTREGEAGVLEELHRHVDESGREEPREDGEADKTAGPPAYSAVLYEDSSNAVDYKSGSSAIDPTLSAYKSLKRMGRGSIEAVRGGINLHIGKTFFRFDFYRLEDVKVGENYIALFMKGSSVVRLILFDEIDERFFEIKRDVENHLQGTR